MLNSTPYLGRENFLGVSADVVVLGFASAVITLAFLSALDGLIFLAPLLSILSFSWDSSLGSDAEVSVSTSFLDSLFLLSQAFCSLISASVPSKASFRAQASSQFSACSVANSRNQELFTKSGTSFEVPSARAFPFLAGSVECTGLLVEGLGYGKCSVAWA